MEFLFTVDWASTESILVLLCLVIFVGIFLYDGFLYLRNVFHLFEPKHNEIEQETPQVEAPEEVTGSLLENKENNTEDISEEIKEEAVTEIQDSIEWEGITDKDNVPMEDIAVEESENKNISGDAEFFREETPIMESSSQDVAQDKEPSLNPEEPQEHEEIPTSEGDQNPLTEIAEIWDTALSESLPGQAWEVQHTREKEFTTPLQDEKQIIENIEEEGVILDEKKNHYEEENLPKTLTEEVFQEAPKENNPRQTPEKSNHSEKLFALVNNIKTLMARGQTLEARGLIIQGLALEKDHRELNMMLASLYEQDRHFEKAEYIYKDLALQYPNDIELFEKLGNVLIIERRYEIALEMYKKILSISGESEGTLYILTHLSHELWQHDLCYEYSKKYQKQWPNNPEILTILAQTEIALGKRRDAIQTLIKLKNLTPYNQEITDMIQKLVLEEELAGNFGEEK